MIQCGGGDQSGLMLRPDTAHLNLEKPGKRAKPQRLSFRSMLFYGLQKQSYTQALAVFVFHCASERLPINKGL